MSPVLQTDPKTPMDGGRSRLAERLATGSDDCEDQLHVGDDLPRFSEIDVDWASAANFEGCGAPISPAPEDARGELEQPSALQDSNDSSEAAGAANLAAQSLQPSNLYAPIVDSAAVAPASSAVEAAPTAAMDARQIATGAPCEASAASILPSAPQNVTTRKHTCQNCRQSKIKCDREYPCSQCKRKNLPCVFLPIETRPKAKFRKKREVRDTESKICGELSYLQIKGRHSSQWPALSNSFQRQRPAMSRDTLGGQFRGRAMIPSHFGHPRVATTDLKQHTENAWGVTHTTALHVPGHELVEGSFQTICANKPRPAIVGHTWPAEVAQVSANTVVNFSSSSRAWPSPCSGEQSSRFQTKSASHGADEKEAMGSGTVPQLSSVYMIESMATWRSEKSPMSQNRGGFPIEDTKIGGLNGIFISVDNVENNTQSLRAAGIAGTKLMNHGSDSGNDSTYDILAPELTLPASQPGPGLMQATSDSLSHPIDAMDFGNERMGTTPRRLCVDRHFNSRDHTDIPSVPQLGIPPEDVKGAEVSQHAGIVRNAKEGELKPPEPRQSVSTSVEDWTRTGLHRLLNGWLEVMQRVIYNQDRAIRTLIHLAHTAVASPQPDLLQLVLFLLKQNGRKFDLCSTLREIEHRKKVAPCQEAHSKDVCLFPLRLNGVDMNACLIIYITVSYGIIQICDANDVFKENVMDSIVNDESVFGILARIFSGDDLLLCYDAMVELYCGVSSEICLMLKYNKSVGHGAAWMKEEATQVRIRYEISDDGSYANYGICMLPPLQ